MINHPIIFQRNFYNDFCPKPIKKQEIEIFPLSQRIACAVLPLLSIHRPFRAPLSLGMSCTRTITHLKDIIENIRQGNSKEAAFHFLHTSLATAAVGLFFFNPVYTYLSSSVSDLIINIRSFVEYANEGNVKMTIESLAFATLDLLLIASICYGTIEITVGCMVLQIILDLYQSAGHFLNGNYLEGMCQAILAGAHMHQLIPQVKVLQWKLQCEPVLMAELKQDKNGFVYLDIPDEYLNSLIKLANDQHIELPPYFGPGKAGAHVSVILKSEIMPKNGLKIDDVGKKFSFRIVNMDAVKPDNWNQVKKVYFLTLSCPEIESMRSRYGFSPKIDGHDFHLTFGIQKN